MDDCTIALLRFRNGALGTLEASRFAYGRKNFLTFEISGSRGATGWSWWSRLDEVKAGQTVSANGKAKAHVKTAKPKRVAKAKRAPSTSLAREARIDKAARADKMPAVVAQVKADADEASHRAGPVIIKRAGRKVAVAA